MKEREKKSKNVTVLSMKERDMEFKDVNYLSEVKDVNYLREVSHMDQDWQLLFEKLDKMDGVEDGRLKKSVFLQWIEALDFQGTISLETKHGLTRQKIMKIIEEADKNRDGYIDREEFLTLVQKDSWRLTRIHRNKLLKYLRVAAYAEEYRWWPPALLILLLSVVQVGVYVYDVLEMSNQGQVISLTGPAPTCSYLIYNPYRRWEAWRFLTYNLVHAGLDHILLNLVLQLLVGLPLELSHGSLRVGCVYFVGVLTGSLITSVTDPGTYLAGASGGVYSLVAAHVAALLLNWKEDSLILRQRLRDRHVTSPTYGKLVRGVRLVLVVTIASVEVTMAMYARYGDGVKSGAKIGVLSHLAGAVSGMVVGLVVLRNRRVEFWETWLRWVCLVGAGVVVVALVVVNAVAQGHFKPSEDRPLGEYCRHR